MLYISINTFNVFLTFFSVILYLEKNFFFGKTYKNFNTTGFEARFSKKSTFNIFFKILYLRFSITYIPTYFRYKNARGERPRGCAVELGSSAHGHRRVPALHQDKHVQLGED